MHIIPYDFAFLSRLRSFFNGIIHHDPFEAQILACELLVDKHPPIACHSIIEDNRFFSSLSLLTDEVIRGTTRVPSLIESRANYSITKNSPPVNIFQEFLFHPPEIPFHCVVTLKDLDTNYFTPSSEQQWESIFYYLWDSQCERLLVK